MSIFGEIFEEILVVPAYRLWRELFEKENQEEEEEEDSDEER